MKVEKIDLDVLLSGEKETIVDKYLEKVCKNHGFILSTFYATDGKKLEKLLAEF